MKSATAGFAFNGARSFERALVAINISLLRIENKFNCCTRKSNSAMTNGKSFYTKHDHQQQTFV
jgi:hypothetical protein